MDLGKRFCKTFQRHMSYEAFLKSKIEPEK